MFTAGLHLIPSVSPRLLQLQLQLHVCVHSLMLLENEKKSNAFTVLSLVCPALHFTFLEDSGTESKCSKTFKNELQEATMGTVEEARVHEMTWTV